MIKAFGRAFMAHAFGRAFIGNAFMVFFLPDLIQKIKTK